MIESWGHVFLNGEIAANLVTLPRVNKKMSLESFQRGADHLPNKISPTCPYKTFFTSSLICTTFGTNIVRKTWPESVMHVMLPAQKKTIKGLLNNKVC
jgi:hypothetical protein